MRFNKLTLVLLVSVFFTPLAAQAEAYLHYTKLWNVSEQEWPSLNNSLVLRTYARNSAGYTVPNGYRVIEAVQNECVVPVPEDLVALVEQVWENSAEDKRYSGANVFVKLKFSGVTEFTITRQREIVNRFHQVRQLLPADYEFLTDHFMSIAEVNSCS